MNLKTTLSFLRSREFRSSWLPPLLMTAGIMIFSGDLGSSQKTRSYIWSLFYPMLSPYWIAQFNYYLRVAGHVLAYGCLYLLWLRAVRGHWRLPWWRAIFWSLGLCLAVALADEGHQALVPTRTGCLRDVGLDMAAASVAAMFTAVFKAMGASSHQAA